MNKSPAALHSNSFSGKNRLEYIQGESTDEFFG